MINIIASIKVKEGCVGEFIEKFKANMPNVLNERGCIEYYPTVDVESGIAIQSKDELVVTILEKWESLDALRAHIKTPHMLEYREEVKHIVEDMNLKILKKT